MQALSLNIVTNSKADSKDLALNQMRSIIYFELRLYILILSLFFIQKNKMWISCKELQQLISLNSLHHIHFI